MSMENFKDSLGDYARDIKLNLGNVLSEDGAPELSARQIAGIALACAFATRDAGLIAAVMDVSGTVDAPLLQAAKAAASVMAMNNVYYRFTHLVSDKDFAKMPARLRMNVIGAPGIDKADFELMCLAVSAINGCGMCMDAHVHEVLKAGVSKTAIHSCVRIASVIQAAGQAHAIAQAG